MGRTYRRGGDEYNSYGKSLREKRQRGNSKKSSSWGDDYTDNKPNFKTKRIEIDHYNEE
jgi:hypothetical protein